MNEEPKETFLEQQRRAAIRAEFAQAKAEHDRKVVPLTRKPNRHEKRAEVAKGPHKPNSLAAAQTLVRRLTRIVSAIVSKEQGGVLEIPLDDINGSLPDVEFETIENANGVLVLRMRAR